MLSAVKNRLLKGGPNSTLLREVFRLQAALHGIFVRTSGGRITLSKGSRRVVLGARDIISVPFVVHEWDRFFDTIEGETRDWHTVLDFSEPKLHCYPKYGVSFYAPSLAEDDSMDAYTSEYTPRAGDVVWDVGAHAGMTAYFLAQLVGPNGKVFAFEPDETNYQFLLRNIEMHKLANVMPVKAALSDKTGTANFCMDGTMSAGLSDFLSYSAAEKNRQVETISFEDACARFGSVPNYAKLDIEGAELSVIASSLDFLKRHPIHLAIESNHVVGGKFTAGPLEELLGSASYRVWSSNKFGQLFTWAQPSVNIPV